MPRLTPELWEKARAEYEVRGVSLGEIGKLFGVATSSISRKAKADGWIQGKLQDLVEREVAATKAFVEVKTQTQELSLRFQHTINSVVEERLQAEGLLASLDVALAVKGAALVKKVATPEDWLTMTRGRRNLAPADKGVSVNVSQQQAQGVAAISPREAMTEIVRQATGGTAEDVATNA
jgi:hypothetical protein